MCVAAPERGLFSFTEGAINDVDADVESLTVLVEISEDGVRRLNKFYDSRWVYVEGFQVGSRVMVTLERDVNKYGEDD